MSCRNGNSRFQQIGRESGLVWRHNRPTIPSESTETGSQQTASSSGESGRLGSRAFSMQSVVFNSIGY